jgi:tRNA(fMet)-specific endonuclease VapC
MTAVAVDSNAYSAFRNGHPDAVEIFSRADYLIAPAIVIGELRSGFAAGSRAAINERELTRFLASPRVSVQDVDERVATVYATVYLQLRLAGKPVPTNDMWIAASALVAGVALVTFDTHFRHVDGLRAGHRWIDVVQ